MRALLGLVLLLVACTDGASPLAPAEVPLAYRDVRTSAEHARHLERGVACRDCHGSAGFAPPDPAVCASCHPRGEMEIHRVHAATSTRAPRCFDCHGFGATPVVASDCLRCHATAQGPAPRIEVHVTAPCLACHLPHQTPALRRGGCESCHAQPVFHGAQRGTATDCTTCHAPHQTGAASALGCASCHASGERPITAQIPGHDCAGCHRPHAPDDQGAVRCERCHAGVRIEHGDAAARCIDCHLPHATPPRPVACTRCHAAGGDHGTSPAHARGVACASCHAPHTPVVLATAALCIGCHARQAVAPGHQSCLGCHTEIHRPRAVDATCARCHADVAQHTPSGHAACASCHDVHGQTTGAECARCHADRVTSPHLRAMRAATGQAPRCTSCHLPHGEDRGPPACASCHAAADLSGLHQTRGHTACASCHGVHRSAPADDRATCVGCHSAQSAHEPAATRCAGCHPFR